jgi:hypothetical protein
MKDGRFKSSNSIGSLASYGRRPEATLARLIDAAFALHAIKQLLGEQPAFPLHVRGHHHDREIANAGNGGNGIAPCAGDVKLIALDVLEVLVARNGRSEVHAGSFVGGRNWTLEKEQEGCGRWRDQSDERQEAREYNRSESIPR